MDDILIINGVKYVKESQIAEMQQNLQNIKKIVNSALADVNSLAGNQLSNHKIEKSVPQVKRDIALVLRKAGKKPYKIKRIDDEGNFYSIHNRKLIFTIKDVLEVRKEFSINTTNQDIEQFSKKISLTIDNIHRIIYNLEIGTFDKYINQWLKSVNDINIKHQSRPIENNPQKRREAGIYS